MEFELKSRYDIGDLLDIVRILRLPGGCPWDAEQTHESIRASFIEETYEVLEAIDCGDTKLLREELGDVLLQVVLHTQMEQEKGAFNFTDVCDELCKKLVYRHPHVFASEEEMSAEQVLDNWEALKNAEKDRKTVQDCLSSVPPALPALMRSAKAQKRAAPFGFEYADALSALRELKAEIEELESAMAAEQGVQHELGDVLFSAVNVARLASVDAEQALSETTRRFSDRVIAVEKMAGERGKTLKQLSDEERDEMWKSVKAQMAQAQPSDMA